MLKVQFQIMIAVANSVMVRYFTRRRDWFTTMAIKDLGGLSYRRATFFEGSDFLAITLESAADID